MNLISDDDYSILVLRSMMPYVHINSLELCEQNINEKKRIVQWNSVSAMHEMSLVNFLLLPPT